MRRYRMADETRDGLLFEMRLMSNPKIMAAKADYEKRLATSRQHAMLLDREMMVQKLREHMPAYIEDLLMKEDIGALRERFAVTFMERAQPGAR